MRHFESISSNLIIIFNQSSMHWLKFIEKYFLSFALQLPMEKFFQKKVSNCLNVIIGLSTYAHVLHFDTSCQQNR